MNHARTRTAMSMSVSAWTTLPPGWAGRGDSVERVRPSSMSVEPVIESQRVHPFRDDPVERVHPAQPQPVDLSAGSEDLHAHIFFFMAFSPAAMTADVMAFSIFLCFGEVTIIVRAMLSAAHLRCSCGPGIGGAIVWIFRLRLAILFPPYRNLRTPRKLLTFFFSLVIFNRLVSRFFNRRENRACRKTG